MSQVDVCRDCSEIVDVRETETLPEHWRQPDPDRLRAVLAEDGILDPEETWDGEWDALLSIAANMAFDASGEVADDWSVRASPPVEKGECHYCGGDLCTVALFLEPTSDTERFAAMECPGCGYDPIDGDDWVEEREHHGEHPDDDVLGLEDAETVERIWRCPECDARVWQEYGAAEALEADATEADADA